MVDPQVLDRARGCAVGAAVGDALGMPLEFGPPRPADRLVREMRAGRLPAGTFTDDTEMALAIVDVLSRHGRIDQEDLAQTFAERYSTDPQRGYGATAHEILAAINEGVAWQDAAGSAFGGEGSMGNGSAMRVAPLGAYFADDLETVQLQVVHVGRRVDGPQGPVNLEGVGGRGPRESLRQHRLDEVPLYDVPLGPLDHLLVPPPGHVGVDGWTRSRGWAGAPAGDRQG